MRSIEIEFEPLESCAWPLVAFAGLSKDSLRRPLTPSEHGPAASGPNSILFVHLARIEDDFEKMIRGHISTPMNPVATLSEAQGEIRSRTQIMAGIHAMSDAEALLRTVGWTGGRSLAQAP